MINVLLWFLFIKKYVQKIIFVVYKYILTLFYSVKLLSFNQNRGQRIPSLVHGIGSRFISGGNLVRKCGNPTFGLITHSRWRTLSLTSNVYRVCKQGKRSCTLSEVCYLVCHWLILLLNLEICKIHIHFMWMIEPLSFVSYGVRKFYNCMACCLCSDAHLPSKMIMYIKKSIVL